MKVTRPGLLHIRDRQWLDAVPSPKGLIICVSAPTSLRCTYALRPQTCKMAQILGRPGQTGHQPQDDPSLLIHIKLINGPLLFDLKATPAEYTAGLKLAIERGWIEIHESGTYVKFTQAGAKLFA